MLERIKLLEENIKELEKLKKRVLLNDLKKDKTLQWSLRYGFLESIQITIDIACHLCSKYNLGNPNTYRECITLLKDFKYISEDLSSKITGMIGLRNLLVHEYVLLDLKKLFNFLARLEDFKEFIKCVREYV